MANDHPAVRHLHCDLGRDVDRHPRPARPGLTAMVGDLPLRHRGAGDGAGGAGPASVAAAEPRASGKRGAARIRAVLRQLQRRLSRRALCHLGTGGDGVRDPAHPQQPARLGHPGTKAEPPLRTRRAGRGGRGGAVVRQRDPGASSARQRHRDRDRADIVGAARRVGRQRLPGDRRAAPLSAASAAGVGDGARRAVRCDHRPGRRRAADDRPATRILGGAAVPVAGGVGAVLQPLFPVHPPRRRGQGGLFECARSDHRDEPVDRVRGLFVDAARCCGGCAGARRDAACAGAATATARRRRARRGLVISPQWAALARS